MRNFLVISLLMLIAACSQSANKMPDTSRMESLEAELKSKETMDTVLGNALIKEYDALVKAAPKDSMAPIYLFKKAQVLKASPGKEEEAVLAFQDIYKNYRYHAKAPEAMLALALFYEEMRLNDRAAANYKTFIATYPSHPLAENAQQLLDLLENTKETEIEMVQKWRKEAKQ